MPHTGKTAVVAESDLPSARLADGALKALGVRVVAVKSDGIAALRSVRETQPDLVLINAHLPPSDGVWLACSVLRLALPVRPAVILSRVRGFRIPAEAALVENGAVLVDRPVAADALERAIRQADLPFRKTPGEVLRALDAMLDRLGFTDHSGRRYLFRAIVLCYHDARLLRNLTGALYPMVGGLFGVSGTKVEQAMRYAIELAWSTGSIEEQYRVFGGTIDARRGKPTCGEMIAQMANILRLEEVQI